MACRKPSGKAESEKRKRRTKGFRHRRTCRFESEISPFPHYSQKKSLENRFGALRAKKMRPARPPGRKICVRGGSSVLEKLLSPLFVHFMETVRRSLEYQLIHCNGDSEEAPMTILLSNYFIPHDTSSLHRNRTSRATANSVRPWFGLGHNNQVPGAWAAARLPTGGSTRHFQLIRQVRVPSARGSFISSSHDGRVR